MRVVLKGVHTVKATLADGAVRAYYYAWRGGPRIDAEPGTPEFQAAYTEAHKKRKRPASGTLFGLIAEFRQSAEYAGLSIASVRAYKDYLKLIEAEFGDLPIEALKDPEARGEFKAWRDTMAATPRKADYAWTVLARVLSFAKDRGRIAVNPCERGGRLYRADRVEKLWSEDHIARFLAVASPALEFAMILALWTGQRQGDLLALTWFSYDGKAIRLRQSKTGARVAIPAGPTLREVLGPKREKDGPILCNSSGEQWTSDGFRASWRKTCARAGIDDVTFHDLRGSAVTRLAIAGASVPEIAAITGHSPKDADEILARHYLGRDVKLAEAAMRKLERNEKRRTPAHAHSNPAGRPKRQRPRGAR